ncbi:MAG: ribonuclease J, partial [Bdellovibrionota bacterium]
MRDSNIKIIPLGGCGEIGMNMTLFCIEERWFFVDGGALFPDASNIGVDLILPDTSFIDENNIQPEAWLITHGHEDHIGALPHLFKRYPAPIYGTEFTIELIKAKFEDANISNAIYNVWKVYTPVLFRNMKVTPFPVNHSIADAAGLFIETNMGNILHMGDFRIDYTPPEHSMTHENLQKVLKNKPVTLMMSDSTNSFSLGSDKSETDITPAFVHYFTKQQGAVIIATFASNIWRLQSVFAAAKDAGRKIVLFGRTMFRNVDIAQRLGLLNYNPDILIPLSEINSVDRSQVCILCTGSQGESFSGLHRLAWGSVSDFQINSDDIVLMSSRIIPGNEKSIEGVVVQLTRIGCAVITTKENAAIHVSGHGYAQDLKTCIQVA